MDMLISPADIIAQTLQRLWLGRVRCSSIPWAAPYPLLSGTRLRHTSDVNVLFPFWDTQSYRVHGAALHVIAEVLQRYSNVNCHVGVGKRCARICRNYLNGLQRKYPDRLTIHAAPQSLDRLKLMQQQDLMVWPAEYTGLCWPASMAVTMGVPVVAWDIYPHNEFLFDGKNSVLVPCEIYVNSYGMPTAHGDYDVFTEKVCGVLDDGLRQLQQTVTDGVVERQDKFARAWRSLLY
jgi:glycosyltransferase involved in cell wall biosynthesis